MWGTRLRLSVRGTGELESDWPAEVEQAWKHFLVERFKPHMASKAD